MLGKLVTVVRGRAGGRRIRILCKRFVLNKEIKEFNFKSFSLAGFNYFELNTRQILFFISVLRLV